MQKYLIKNINIVNEGSIQNGDILIFGERIEKIASGISVKYKIEEINGHGHYILPGVIDDQVHFREPGLTHKATISSESKAAVAGGITSFMEMPNTLPPAFTQELLEEKYTLASNRSVANYSFYMGTSNDNLEEVLKTNDKKKDVCGIKIFMGSSTGNLLVDNYITLDRIFGNSEVLIATHCEDESLIKRNLEQIKSEKSGLVVSDHPVIRNEEVCFESSFKAVQLAKKNNTRLHILHISTEKELQLFTNILPIESKRITSEVCVHHLEFTSDDYPTFGNMIKCNPAIKAKFNREALWKALLDDRLDVIATDHAPHTWQEKLQPYEKAPSGIPLVQHSLLILLDYFKQGRISLEKIAEKMSHSVAACFCIQERGYIREGYFADLVIVNPDRPFTVDGDNLMYKCGWSPFTGRTFTCSVTHTFVNGNLVYKLEDPDYGNFLWNESQMGKRLLFRR